MRGRQAGSLSYFGETMPTAIKLDLNLGGMLESVRKHFDDKKFTEQEKAEIDLTLRRAEGDVVQKEMEYRRALMDAEGRVAEAESAVLVAEASGGWLQRNWRPMLMVLFALMLLLMWCGVSSEQLTEELKMELMSLIKLGMGGYIAGRTERKTLMGSLDIDAAVYVGIFVMIGVFLLGGFVLILKIIDHFRAKPPNHEKFATISTVANCRARCDTEMERVRSDLKEYRKDDAKGRSKIHRDVRSIEQTTAAQESSIQMINQTVCRMETKLDKVLVRKGGI